MVFVDDINASYLPRGIVKLNLETSGNLKEKEILISKLIHYNQFEANVPLYQLRTSENPWFFDIFRGYRNRTLA